MSSNNPDIRSKKIEDVKADLLKHGWPRFQISIILSTTALTAFLTSAILLRFDVTSMTIRYPFAVIVAYLMFLVLLKFWLLFQRGDLGIDIPDLSDIPLSFGSTGRSSGSTSDVEFGFGKGGDFDGGGTGGDWTPGSVSTFHAPITPVNIPTANAGLGSTMNASGSGGSFLDNFDLDFDIEGFILVIVGVLLFSAIILLALYVIYIAPVMLAEIMLDGILAGGLYKTVKGLERRHWLSTALKKTAIPVALIVILSGFAGLCFEAAVPEARTIGDVYKAVFTDETL